MKILKKKKKRLSPLCFSSLMNQCSALNLNIMMSNPNTGAKRQQTHKMLTKMNCSLNARSASPPNISGHNSDLSALLSEDDH